jgi:hypothetical protein
MTTPNNTPTRVDRRGHLRWVAVADVHVNPVAQRELRPGWAAQIAADFDPDRFTPPLVSLRGGKHYVIDGQHRFEAMRLMGWDDQQVQCWVYEGLTDAQEADLFLWHNNRKAVSAFDKFQIGVTADRPDETDINRIVLSNGLKVASGQPGGIGAVGALRNVYGHGPAVLGRTLRIIRDAYGDAGLRSHVIEGIGLVCARYNGDVDDATMVERLGSVHAGVNGLENQAHNLRKQLGRPLKQCVAGAAVEIVNAKRGGKKLPSWWT